MSALPIAQFCAQGPSAIGSRREAAVSNAYHAKCANKPEARDLIARLTKDELAELDSWQAPQDATLPGGLLLRYQDAVKEVEVAIDEWGAHVEATDPRAVSVGHLDFAWVCKVHGKRIAYVADLKRTEWTSTPDSLQLAAYGFAWASKHGCDMFCTGIWAASESTWTWGPLVDLESTEALDLLRRVVAAARNTGDEYSTGAHCRGCYKRFQCPAHLVAPGAVGELALLAKELTPDDAPKVVALLLQAQAAEDAIKTVKQAAQDFAARFGLPDGRGKEYRAVTTKGKPSFDLKAAQAVLGEQLKPYMKTGAPFESWRWCNARGE